MKFKRTLWRNRAGYCGVSIPEQIAAELQVPKDGMAVELEIRRGKLILTPAPLEVE